MRLWVPWGHRPCHIHLCFCSSRMGRDLSNGKRVFGTKYEGVSENHLSYLSAYLCPILSKSSPSHGLPTLGFFFSDLFLSDLLFTHPTRNPNSPVLWWLLSSLKTELVNDGSCDWICNSGRIFWNCSEAQCILSLGQGSENLPTLLDLPIVDNGWKCQEI